MVEVCRGAEEVGGDVGIAGGAGGGSMVLEMSGKGGGFNMRGYGLVGGEFDVVWGWRGRA